MIYIFDNGESDNAIYFVEAPPDFGDWWKTIFDPWQNEHGGRYVLLGVAPSVTWWEGEAVPVSQFLPRGAGRPKYSPAAQTKRSVKTTTTTIALTAADIRGFLKVPAHAEVTIYVPGGGDWSCTDLHIAESEGSDQCVRVTYVEEERG